MNVPPARQRCGAKNPKTSALCVLDAEHTRDHYDGRSFHWRGPSATATPSPPTSSKKPAKPSKRSEPKKHGADQLAAAGYCGTTFNGKHKTARNILCTLTKGHPGPHENTSIGVKEHVEAKAQSLTDKCSKCGLELGEHDGAKCPKPDNASKERCDHVYSLIEGAARGVAAGEIAAIHRNALRELERAGRIVYRNERWYPEDPDAGIGAAARAALDEVFGDDGSTPSKARKVHKAELVEESDEPAYEPDDIDLANAQLESTALVKVDEPAPMMLSVERAREFLAKSMNVDEVRDVADKAKAASLYLRTISASVESQNAAVEIRLIAERRLGEISAEIGIDGRGGNRKKSKTAPDAALKKPTKKEALADLGLKEREARRFEELAKIPEKKFEALVADTKAKGERLTASAPLKLVRQEDKAKKAADLRAKPVPQADGRFDVIVIDPPWKHDVRAADITQRGQGDYPRMELDAIKALPVADRAEKNCILFCWVTNQHMRQVYECLDAWGFREVSIVTWAKSRFGTGQKIRGQTEHCIMAVRGSPLVTLTNESTWIEGDLREHSRKPESFYELVESLCPGTKLEMFARAPFSEQWAVWGNETEKFKGAA